MMADSSLIFNITSTTMPLFTNEFTTLHTDDYPSGNHSDHGEFDEAHQYKSGDGYIGGHTIPQVRYFCAKNDAKSVKLYALMIPM